MGFPVNFAPFRAKVMGIFVVIAGFLRHYRVILCSFGYGSSSKDFSEKCLTMCFALWFAFSMARPTRHCSKCGEYVTDGYVTNPVTMKTEKKLIHINADGSRIYRNHNATEG